MNYYSIVVDEVLRKLRTNRNGLLDREANNRLNKYGLNELPKKKKDSVLKIFFSELLDPIVLLLFLAAIASFSIGEILDGVAILVIILIDLIIGTYEENKANTTIESLNSLVKEMALVVRNGKEKEIDSTKIVIGDIVVLDSGDKIPADLRIIDSYNLTIDESILTGESLGVLKNNNKLPDKECAISSQSNMLFAGCTVLTGRALGVVVATGVNTEVGKIASTLNNTVEEQSPLTIRINDFSRKISLFIVCFSIVLTITFLLKGYLWSDILILVIALGVSAMPEGLPLALTMALTISSRRLASKKVITKKLYSVESLGSCTVIASDKTGTLTVNEQTAKKIVLPNGLEYMITGEGYSTKGVVAGEKLEYAYEIAKLGVINNEAKFSKSEKIGDSVDLAFLVLGEKLKIKIDDIKTIDVIPYESQNRYSAVFYEKDGDTYCTVKGSLEVVKNFCSTINFKKSLSFSSVDEQNNLLSSDGYRVIAIANGKVSKKENYSEEDIADLKFMGCVGFIDPIRKEAVSSIKNCVNAGIKVLMITGDHPLTAGKIAKELKLIDDNSLVTTGVELDKYLKKSLNEFDKFVKEKTVFARVTPMQKLEIIESLKRSGEFVAVGGDGVNDTLALKAANIGVAMGSGTDIAKDTAKMVVLDDNFKSIADGVFEGRVAYENIRKITYFLLSCGLAEVLFFVLSILFNMPIPLLAIQLLWLNVVTDGIQDIALSFEKGDKYIMKKKPRRVNDGLFDKVMIQEVAIAGISIGLLVFMVWLVLLNVLKMDASVARSYIVALMIIIQNVHVFNCRSEDKSIFSIPIGGNKVFLIGIMCSVLLGLLVLEVDIFSNILKTTHIPFADLGILFGLSLIIIIVMEIYKKVKSLDDELE